MFINFPVIVDERVELGERVSSSRNAALGDKRVESIAKPGTDCRQTITTFTSSAGEVS